jgi:hypothetical protein
MLEQTQDEIAIAILKKLHKSERTLPAAVSGALIQSSNGANNPNALIERIHRFGKLPYNRLLGHMTKDEILARKTGVRWKCRPDGKQGKHKTVSHASHSPW